MAGILSFPEIYHTFDAPIAALDCGDRCAPYNERGVPFCCDTNHVIPSAYDDEWRYLSAHTDLWHQWESEDHLLVDKLKRQLPENQMLIECKGHLACQRDFRAITCRSFPFFPYLTLKGDFIGLSYYWEFEDRCWVISNLGLVSGEYRIQIYAAFETVFSQMPSERDGFHYQSIRMRRIFGRWKRAIPLLHRNGSAYKITPRTGRMRRVAVESFGKYGPHKIAAMLPFSNED